MEEILAQLGVTADTRLTDLTVGQYLMLVELVSKPSSVEITKGQSGSVGFSIKEYERSTQLAARLARATFTELEMSLPAKGGK